MVMEGQVDDHRHGAGRSGREYVRSDGREVFIRREGENVVLTPRPTDWPGIFASGQTVSDDFMAGAERKPVQERSF
jgi:antitoxin VapB